MSATHDHDAVAAESARRLAETLLRASRSAETRRERRLRARVGRLLDDPVGKRFTLALTDQVVRVRSAPRAARLFHDHVTREGVPAFPGAVDRLAIGVGARLAPRFPSVVMPLVSARLRREMAGVVLSAEDPAFAAHVRRRRSEGIKLNVNLLGEAVLGEAEALRRRDALISALARPDIDYVSVKISAVCSQLNVLAFENEVERIADRLRPLFVEAARHDPPKFVNLDMEEYGDLHLTVAVFQRLLDEPELRSVVAGIVLQAYLPDSHDALIQLCEWAHRRHREGGGRIKVRLVKGANLAMEQVEAELHGWEQAPYGSKAEVDANFKRLLDVALEERFGDAVRVGVASHNLFDVAWALVRRQEAGACDRVELEMLEGMATAEARVARDEAGGILLYAPVVGPDEFDSAIAYLVRRLDENTGDENFLRAAFSLSPGSVEWEQQQQRFLEAVRSRRSVGTRPRRQQDRRLILPPTPPEAPFVNEPDTDWALPANRAWITEHLSTAVDEMIDVVPAVVAGEELVSGHGAAPARLVGDLLRAPAHVLADEDLVERAVATARQAGKEWEARPFAERRQVLSRVADVMARHRGTTLAAMAWDAGKTVREGDPEVSEACDFARYYASAVDKIQALAADGIDFRPMGTVVVASPWNFPYAIPAGGVLAALAAGNAVILKPAPETVHTAWLLARHCWEAGVPRDVLQFLPCPDDHVGRRLVTHPEIDAVVLTGSAETARMFLDWKPGLRLFAETSGKNAVVVTAAADIDAAVRDIVQSAFGHAGQKCSAASLAIVEAAVHDDDAFRRQLADAVRSLDVGPAWDVRTDIGPLIRPPVGPLADALCRLEPGEEWLVEPRRLDDEGYLWGPGVKLGVKPGSPFHTTECFGPVLGVMRVRDLEEAITVQNATSFGLTGGIHSLDVAEITRWRDAVEVGNAYINRGITGAIVRRQPFGGWKGSVVGPAAKAGGPNYVFSLGHFDTAEPRSMATVLASLEGWWAAEFSLDHDPTGLRAERNVFRYRPLPNGVLLRLGVGASQFDLEVALAAARVAGVTVTVSVDSRSRVRAAGGAVVEDETAFVRRMAGARVDRVRLLGSVGDDVRRAAYAAHLPADNTPVVPHGRIELLCWVREQSVSETRHRHGNVVDEGS